MPTPKSVIKIKKVKGSSSVEYTSNIDATQYYMHELSRAAMRDVGKFVKKKWQEAYDSHFKKHTGFGRKATSVKVIANEKTTAPRVQIGLEHSHRGKEVEGFYAYFQEFGSSKQPRLGLLTKATEDNLAEIIKIESQYLSALSDEASRIEGLIDEREYNEED